MYNIFLSFWRFFARLAERTGIRTGWLSGISKQVSADPSFPPGELHDCNPDIQNNYHMAKKTVITRVLEVDANESIVEFPQNRTLLVEQLTDDPPVKAEILNDLRSMDDVFAHFKPKVNMEFESPDGQTRKEELAFKSLQDFELKGLMQNSQFLKDLGHQKENFQKIEKQLKTNKILREAISDPESRDALIASLKALLKELQETR